MLCWPCRLPRPVVGLRPTSHEVHHLMLLPRRTSSTPRAAVVSHPKSPGRGGGGTRSRGRKVTEEGGVAFSWKPLLRVGHLSQCAVPHLPHQRPPLFARTTGPGLPRPQVHRHGRGHRGQRAASGLAYGAGRPGPSEDRPRSWDGESLFIGG